MTDANDKTLESLVGTPSDEAPAVLATGRTDISTLYVSMSGRHPDMDDAGYLRWHTLDHRPEQYRLASLRSSLRIVSTPECRAARAACDPRFDAVDHVMTYFFADVEGLDDFYQLAVALKEAGRIPYLLPAVERGAYAVDRMAAAAEIKAGADVLPWWPASGVYLLVEESDSDATPLIEVGGVGGIWSARAIPTDISDAAEGQQISYLFLDADPVATARRLQPVLEERWQKSGIKPLFAAPFHVIVPGDWHRYLP